MTVYTRHGSMSGKKILGFCKKCCMKYDTLTYRKDVTGEEFYYDDGVNLPLVEASKISFMTTELYNFLPYLRRVLY